MCSTVSTSPGFAVFTGAAALDAGGGVEGCDGFCAPLRPIAPQKPRPRQTVKTLVVSILMANNLTAFGGSCKHQVAMGRNAISVLPYITAHRRFFIGML